MIEPTDQQVAAFKAAWEVESHRVYSRPGERYQPGDRTRAGLRAVLALPQRLPTQEEAILALADTTMMTAGSWRAIVQAVQNGLTIRAERSLSLTQIQPHEFVPFDDRTLPWCEVCGLLQRRIDVHLLPRSSPHQFVGHLDRHCEVVGCDLPDRAMVHRIWNALPNEDEGAS